MVEMWKEDCTVRLILAFDLILNFVLRRIMDCHSSLFRKVKKKKNDDNAFLIHFYNKYVYKMPLELHNLH